MISTLSLLAAFLLKVCLPLLVVVALIDLATMSRARRVRMLRRSGHTWKAIAARYGVKSPNTPKAWARA